MQGDAGVVRMSGDEPVAVLMARRTLVAVAVVLVLATPVATWSAVGDVSEPINDSDYMIRPIELPAGLEGAVRAGSIAIALAALGILVWARLKGQFDRSWRAPIVLLVAAGMIVGAGWRVLTAGVGGANIGGGMVIVFGGPLVLGLVVAGLLCAAFPPGRRRASQ